MLKLVGAAAILLSAFLYGRVLTDKKRERLSYMENMITAAEKFKALIASKTPIGDALCMCEIEKEKAVTGEDKEALERFFTALDVETESGVLEAASIFSDTLKKDEEAEREKYTREAKVIGGASVAVGLLVCVLLV